MSTTNSKTVTRTPAELNRSPPEDLEDWLWLALPTLNLLYLHLFLSRENDDGAVSGGDGLILLLLLGPSAWVCWILGVVHKFRVMLSREDESSAPPTSARKQGRLMAMTLIPSLAHSVAMVATPLLSTTSGFPSRWILYAKWTTLSSAFWLFIGDGDQTKQTRHGEFRILRATVMVGMTLGLLYNPRNAKTSVTTFLLAPWESILWAVLHWLASRQYHRFFVKQSSPKKDDKDGEKTYPVDIEFQMATWGEYQTLVFIVIIVCMEWISSVLYSKDHVVDATASSPSERGDAASTAYIYYPLVAKSGVLGCLSSVVSMIWISSRLSFVSKLVLQIAAPLGVVELCLGIQQYAPSSTLGVYIHFLPRCLQWLLDFFLSSEPSSTSGPSSWPRFVGVLYWACALLVLTAPTLSFVQGRQHSVVVTRKWFHLIAIILFAPTTHFFPQLMALGYAVALCGLFVLETLRRDAAVLNDFYRLVQDPTKDFSEGIILSHICLILGCAMPLWLSQVIKYNSGEQGCKLLSQWGILSLGVGDATGAVVGKTFGRMRWGKNHRTVEGSLAMWTSMLGVGWVFFKAANDHWMPLLVSTTFSTLLEAYTIHMDNLVLPLAGSVWIVLLYGIVNVPAK